MKCKSSLFRLSLLVLCAGALLVACSLLGGPTANTASLRIVIGNRIAAKTIAPPTADTTVDYYLVTGTGPYGEALSAEPINVPGSSATTTVPNLVVGTWSITVDAYNSGNDQIGTVTQNVSVNLGQNSVDIQVGPISGTGTLTVTVDFAGVTMAQPNITATLTPQSGQTTDTSLSAFTVSGTSLISTSTLQNGYYLLAMTLFDGTVQQAPTVTEVVWIVTDQTSSQTYTYGGGSLGITITPLPTSLDVILVPDATSPTTLNIEVSNPPTATLLYQWFVDGIQQSGQTGSSFDYGALAAGIHCVTGVAYTAGWAQAGSALQFVFVEEPFVDPFVGTWVITAETIDGNPIPVGAGPGAVSATMVIKSDYNLTVSGTGMGTPITGTGTWSKNGSTYTLSVVNDISGQTQNVSLTGSLSSDNETFTGSGTAVMGPNTQTCNLVAMQKEPFVDPFVGTWVITAETVDGTPMSIGPDSGQVSGTFVIASDYTLTISGNGMGTPFSGTGTWSKSGSDYTLISNVPFPGATQTSTITGYLSTDEETFTGSGTAVLTPPGDITVVDLLVMQKQ
jgi:hypothetical protein